MGATVTHFSEDWYAKRIGAIAGELAARIVPRTPAKPKTASLFPGMCVAAGYPRPVEEYQFHPTRKWRFDFAWPEKKLAIEQEGAIWQRGGGGHSHPLGIERDIDKYNAAALLGWRILRYAPEDLALAIIDLRGMFNEDPR